MIRRALLLAMLTLGACDASDPVPSGAVVDGPAETRALLDRHSESVLASLPTAELLALARLAYRQTVQPAARERFFSALFDRLDPVWGGLLRAAPEQLASLGGSATALKEQGTALLLFVELYAQTRERRFERAFERVDGYLQDRLRDGVAEGAGYRAGEALAPALPSRVSVSEYWQLRREHDRRQLGLPDRIGVASSAALVQLGLAYAVAGKAFRSPNYEAEAERLGKFLSSQNPAAAGLTVTDGVARYSERWFRALAQQSDEPSDAPASVAALSAWWERAEADKTGGSTP